MTSSDNLKKGKKTQFKSGEKAADAGRKGGIKSGESKRAKKAFKELLTIALEQSIKDKKSGNEISTKEAVVLALIKEALKGNIRAYEAIQKAIGEEPAQKLLFAEVEQSVIDEVERMVTDGE